MTKHFRGRFDCKVDPKGRVILPSAYRDLRSAKANAHWVVTNGLTSQRRCLDLYLATEWERLEKKIAQMPQLNRDVQTYQRFYLSGGQDLQLDSQYRLSLPQPLRKYADTEGDVILVGMGNKIEIWAASVWNDLQTEMTKNFEDVLVQVAALEEP